MAKVTRFTIYDVMEQRGEFAKNSANADSKLPDGSAAYIGPVEYPKMLYHPKGEQRIVIAATAEVTPFGPKMLGEQREIIHLIVNNLEEEKKATSDGWHKKVTAAVAAGGGVVQELRTEASFNDKVKSLEDTIAELTRRLGTSPVEVASPSKTKATL